MQTAYVGSLVTILILHEPLLLHLNSYLIHILMKFVTLHTIFDKPWRGGFPPHPTLTKWLMRQVVRMKLDQVNIKGGVYIGWIVLRSPPHTHSIWQLSINRQEVNVNSDTHQFQRNFQKLLALQDQLDFASWWQQLLLHWAQVRKVRSPQLAIEESFVNCNCICIWLL